MSELAAFLERISDAARLEGRPPPVIKTDCRSASILAEILRSQFSLPPETDPQVAVTYCAVRVVAEVAKDGKLVKSPSADWPADYRDAFWAKYPNRKAKAHAMKALDKIGFAGKTAWVDLMAGLERYISSPDVLRGFVKHPATWLNAECWKDEDGPTPHPDKPRNPGFFEMIATGE